ncbi:ATP-binding cassette domain-containing protein [Aeromonas veronii]|uniref:ATP-binding cassette domain-containing protein n=1 Tax=Aeromonas veronii TaxID=654 RepID=UPI002442701F|nr:ATP-binding cassette domain-containing protein [Aeromonas veronii]
MISLQGLTIGHAAHPDHFQLGPLDIELKEGEWLAILGGNGAGKSLLAQLLAGGLDPAAPRHADGRGRHSRAAP